MGAEPDAIYYSGTAVVIALLPAAVLWRRQAKQGVTLGPLRILAMFLVVLLTCAACIVGLVTASEATGLQNGKWLTQAFWVISGITAYFVGGQVVIRLRRATGNAQQPH